MSYTKHNFQTGGTIQAAPFNAMEDQIAANEEAIAGKASAVDLSAIQTKLSYISGVSAYVEQGETPPYTASRSYAKGDYILLGSTLSLFAAKAAIAEGETLVAGTNITMVSNPLGTEIAKKLDKPNTDGFAAQILKSNGNGTASWADENLNAIAKQALASFLTNMAQLIPNLAYTTVSHNGAATASAATATVQALGLSGGGSTPATHLVTYSLTNCASSNMAASVNAYGSYTTTITADSTYLLDTVIVRMAGTDITSTVYNSSTGVVYIPFVNGNIAITATATYAQTITVYHTVTKNLTNCTSSNAAASVENQTSYTTTITANNGYTMDTVAVTMGGTDITSSAYNSSTGVISIASVTGSIAITATAASAQSGTAYTVTNTLSNCTSSNAAASVNENSSYTTTITASSGYTLGTVTVTMGGTDITSTAWTSGTGVVSIATVTGNIVITASASVALPSGYTALTYIATDGSQYIDPQITSGAVHHVEYEIMLTALNSDDTSLSSSDQAYQKGNHIFSGRNCYFPYLTGNSSGWRNTLYGNRFGSQTPSGENETNAFDWNLNQRYVLSGYADGAVKVDGVTKYHLDVGGSEIGETMTFFAYGYESNKRKYRFRGRLYYAKLYDSTNTLIHDYVPCKNSSNVAGLYDLVGETFISSATSDALIAGEVA